MTTRKYVEDYGIENMLFGLEKLSEKFKRLADENKLSHAYLFFGEPQTGKFSFALALANYLETGSFEPTNRLLIDALILKPSENEDDEDVWGIDRAREAKNFLWQKPLASKRRVVIFDQADTLTDEAQNALLKIMEEPPASALIIMIGLDASALRPTLASRISKIHFPRLSTGDLTEYLVKAAGLTEKNAVEAARKSFGRPGRAIELAKGGKSRPAEAEESGRGEPVESARGEPAESAEEIIENFLLSLRANLLKNSGRLKWLLDRYVLLKRHPLNQKLQIKAIREMRKIDTNGY